MGEVYRADDLKLSQPVAFKFLPGTAECVYRWGATLEAERHILVTLRKIIVARY